MGDLFSKSSGIKNKRNEKPCFRRTRNNRKAKDTKDNWKKKKICQKKTKKKISH